MTDTQAPDVVGKREFLLLASYCGAENEADCSDAKPCADCLAMCNIFKVADPDPTYLRMLGERGPSQARIEELEAALEWAMSYARNQSTDEEGLARAEAALSSAIGEPYEFSGWVEVVEDDRGR